jgi:sialidase-1
MIRNWETAREMGRRMVLSRSEDGGHTWIEQDVTDTFYNYPGAGLAWFIGHGIQLQRGPHAGRLLIPGRTFAAGWEDFDPSIHKVVKHSAGAGWIWDVGGVQASEILNAGAYNCVAYSDDHGESWQWGGHAQGFTGEACIVELSDGSVIINNRNHDFRTLGYRSWAISRDGGETFSEFGVDPALVEGRCHASLALYNHPDGDEPGRILFLNPAAFDNVRQDPAPRHHMTVRLSYDDGKTWPISKCLWEGNGGYSDMIVLEDGTILCGFEVSRTGFARDEVMLCRFNMAWLES